MTYDQITADLMTENRALRALLDKVDREYGLSGSWAGNGCEHGLKPAAACPNKECAVAEIQREWERLLAPNAKAAWMLDRSVRPRL